MAERYKSIFFAILSLAIVWLVIILFFLTQEDTNLEQWPVSQPHLTSSRSPKRREDSTNPKGDKLRRRSNEFTDQLPKPLEFIRQSKSLLNINELLFYQFDPYNEESFSNKSVSKDLHDKVTRKLGSVIGTIDQYVKTEGFNLFSFNLLASNRIGLTRPLPDTRHKKCHITNSETQNLATNSTNFETSTYTHTSTSKKINLLASIIICYYNEAPSALLRTIHTVIERSPNHLLREIIVVDDFSHDEYSRDKMKSLIRSDLVNFVRTTKREGLIRARLFGADLAKGDALIFLDSHVEANIGWLEPLLEAVQENSTTIACPMIDLINAETLIYSSSPMVKGGLNWALNFKWDSVPSEALRSYDDFIRPIESPTMAGGLYAIKRDFFYQLGTYDSGMDLWGGENVELSLRAWMCGGRILILPCSRLGHIFRKKRPYGLEPDQPDSLLVNSHRAAKVWLGDYIEKFYEANPSARYLVSGNVDQRIDLKHHLGCKNFSWFLDNVYPSLKASQLITNSKKVEGRPKLFKFNSNTKRVDRSIIRRRGLNLETSEDIAVARSQRQLTHHFDSPDQDWPGNKFPHPKIINHSERMSSHQKHIDGTKRFSSAPEMVSQFQIESSNSNLCIESKKGFLAKGFTRLVLNFCAEVKRGENGEVSVDNSTLMNQLWTETELHDYRLGDQCLDLIKFLPLMRKCHHMGSFQNWTHDIHNTSETSIINSGGSLCLGVERVQVGEPIIVTICEKKIAETGESKKGLVDIAHGGYSRHADWMSRPGWRTGSSLFRNGRKYRESSGLESLQPCQKWNLIFVFSNNSTTRRVTQQQRSHSGYD